MPEILNERIRRAVRSELGRGASPRRKHNCVRAQMSALPLKTETAIVCKLMHACVQPNGNVQAFELEAEQIDDRGSLPPRGIDPPAVIGQKYSAHTLQKAHRLTVSEPR